MRRLWLLLGIVTILFSVILNFSVAQNTCDISSASSPLDEGRLLLDCDQAEDAIIVLMDLLNSTDDAVQRAEIQVTLGAAYYAVENYLDSQVQYERAFITYNSNDMLEEAGRAYYGAGLAKVGRNQISDAMTYFAEAIRRSEQVDDTLNLARTHYAISTIQFNAKDYDMALDSANQALSYYDATNDQESILSALRQVVRIYLAQGNIIDAFATLEEGIEIAREIGADADLAPMLLQLAQARIVNGQYPEAITLLNETRTVYVSLNDNTGLVNTLIAIADVYTRWANFPQADSILRQVEDIINESTSCAITMQAKNARGNYYNATGLYQNAGGFFQQTINSECANDEVQLVARAHLGLGKSWFERGYIIFGGDEYQFALGDFRGINDTVGEVDALIRISEYWLRRRRTSEAYDYAFTASTIARENGNNDGVIRAEIALSIIDKREGAFDTSLERMEGALNLAISTDNTAMQAYTLEQIADLYFLQARYDDAISFWTRAQATYGADDNGSFNAQLEFNRALILEVNGDIAQAVTIYQSARDQFEAIEDQRGIIRVDLAIGRLYEELGLYDQSEPYYIAALSRSESTGNDQLRADALTKLGSIGLQRIDFAERQGTPMAESRETLILDQAQRRFFEALDIYVALEDTDGQAEVLNELGLLGLRRLIPVQFGTSGFFLNALELSRDNGNVRLEADVLTNLGYYNEVVGQSAQALNYYQQALRIANQFNPALATRIRIRMGYIYELQGDNYNFILSYREAIDSLESLYILLGSQSTQTEFGTQASNLLPYERLIRYYGLNIVDGRERDAETALNYVERSRARSLLFQLSGEDLEFNQSNDAELSDWRQTRDDILQLYDDLATAREQEQDTEAITAEIAEREAELETLQQDEDITSLMQVFTINTVSLDDLQGSLPENTAMLVYHISPETHTEIRNEAGRIFTFVITRDSITQQPTLIDSYETDIVNLINLFRRNPRNTEALTTLHSLLIKPIAGQIVGYDNLIIVPHDVLNYLPYEALIDEEGGSLVDNYNISYTPSATTYYLLAQRDLTDSDGAPLIASYGDDLFFAKEEADTVAETLNVVALTDEAATETAIRASAMNADVIHIAAHGEFNPQQSLDSYLRLAPDGSNDGSLTVREIYSLDLRVHNPLVVLSACNTAVSEVNPGDEFQNMTRAFLLTGSRGVIASLWAVDDVATSELMVAFYSNREDGMNNTEALAAAKRTVRENFPNPYYWAGFVLIGVG